MKGCDLVVAMTRTDSIVAITARKFENSFSLCGGSAAVDVREADRPSVEIHADVFPHGTPALANTEFLAAVDPSMVFDAALTWTLDILTALRHAVAMFVVIVIVVMQVLVAKVVHKDVSDASVR